MRSYIKIKPTKHFPMSIPDKRNLSDEEWKEHIFNHIISFYKETSDEIISKIIEKEKAKTKKNNEIEISISKYIENWLINNRRFIRNRFIVNLEPRNKGKKEGYYDIKIEHSDWGEYPNRPYFPFECKNLGTSTLLNEYVLVDNKSKKDGGMYRFFVDKYAVEQNFGGMIGFVIHESEKPIIEQLIEKIEKSYSSYETGNLCNNKIVRNSIFGNENTFDTNHFRTYNNSEIVLHHIIMDFVNY